MNKGLDISVNNDNELFIGGRIVYGNWADFDFDAQSEYKIQADSANSQLFVAKYNLNQITSNNKVINNNIGNVYPNPTTGGLFVANLEDKSNYSVYDSQGVLLFNGSYNSEGIDVSNLSVGVYFVQTSSGNFQFVKK